MKLGINTVDKKILDRTSKDLILRLESQSDQIDRLNDRINLLKKENIELGHRLYSLEHRIYEFRI